MVTKRQVQRTKEENIHLQEERRIWGGIGTLEEKEGWKRWQPLIGCRQAQLTLSEGSGNIPSSILSSSRTMQAARVVVHERFPFMASGLNFFFFLSKCGSQAHDPKIKSPPSTKLSQVPLPTPTTNSILSKISFIHFHNSNILFFELGGIYTNICFIITHYPGIYVLFFCLYIAQQIFFPKKSQKPGQI